MYKVSIIIPIYNAEEYLRECLDSVINQTLKEIEIICVNDGSKDSSLRILEEYSLLDNRIKIISQENSGYGRAMNVGMDAATGEYIGIVESDDKASPEMYQELYDLAVTNQAQVVKACFYRFDSNGKRKENLTTLKEYYNRIIDPHEHPVVFQFAMNTWSGIYSREYLSKYHIRHNETPGASYQDNGFWFQTLAYCNRAFFSDKAYYLNRRDNPNSSVFSKSKVYCMCDEFEYIYKIIKANIDTMWPFIGMYWYKKFHNYQFTLNRIDLQFKSEFIQRFSAEFHQGMNDGEIDMSLFSPNDTERIYTLINTPEHYYLINRLIHVEAKSHQLQKQLNLINNSKALLIGNVILYIPRKIKSLLRIFSKQ